MVAKKEHEMGRHRDYRKEDKYEASPKQIKDRENRNKARAHMIRAGKAHKGDGKDIAHKNNNTFDENESNLAVQSPSENRSFPRDKKARRKGKQGK